MRILITRLRILLDSRLAQIDRENIILAKSLNVSVKLYLHPLDERRELIAIALSRQANLNHQKFKLDSPGERLRQRLSVRENCQN
jgi:hypothetical protein